MGRRAAVVLTRPSFGIGIELSHGEITFHKGALVAGVPLRVSDEGRDLRAGSAFSLPTERVRKAVDGDPEFFRQLAGDMRYSKRRPEILRACGLNETMTYNEMVAIKGGITAEEILAGDAVTHDAEGFSALSLFPLLEMDPCCCGRDTPRAM